MTPEAQALLWCLFPDFDLQLEQSSRTAGFRERLRPHVVPEAFRRFRASTHIAHGDALVVTRSLNEERVLYPIFARATRRAVDVTETRRAGRMAPRSAVVREVKEWILHTLNRLQRTDLQTSWTDVAVATFAELERYNVANLSDFRFVLVARQSHPFVRALSLRAHEHGTPVAFIPHSPLTRWQVDLPVTHAGVRGSAERAYINARTAADIRRISVIGNPGTDLLASPPPDIASGVPGVLALSPDPVPRLQAIIEMVRESDPPTLIVAPHPRSDLKVLRKLLPPQWALFSGGRTLDLLASGVPWLIQSSSGVAWESAALGIPTADIRPGRRQPDYPFLDRAGQSVTPITTPAELRKFFVTAPDVNRLSVREGVLDWCATDGQPSRESARAFLRSIERSQSPTFINDGWAPGGSLRERSRLIP